jgi:NAD(P)-dependent dehydrogenase (short-subunit alcohol dehydrogenase family)
MARRQELGDQLARKIETSGGRFTFVRGDITRPADCERAVRVALDAYGRLNVLVNNAAKGTPLMRLEDTSDEDWDSLVEPTLKGSFRMCRAAIPVMREQKDGVIISVSSTGGAEGGSCENFGTYGAAKAGVHQLMRVIAIENGDKNVRAMTVVMGGVDTPMAAEAIESLTQLKGVGEFAEQAKAAAAAIFMRPEHVAQSIAVLCDSDNREITGATITIDRSWSTGYGVSNIFGAAAMAGVQSAGAT